MHFVGHHSRTNPPAALVRAWAASGVHSYVMHQTHQSTGTRTAKVDANRVPRQQSPPASRSLRMGRRRDARAARRSARGARGGTHPPLAGARVARVRLGVKRVLAVLQPHALVRVQAARRRRLARQQGLRGPIASGGARCAAHASAVRERGVPTTCAGAAERLRRASRAGSYQDDKGVRDRQAALHCAAATHLSPNPRQTLRTADQARGAGSTAASQVWGGGSPAAQLRTALPVRQDSPAARDAERPGAPMKIHCHPRSPPFPFRYSSPAASGAPMICSRHPASGRCQLPKCNCTTTGRHLCRALCTQQSCPPCASTVGWKRRGGARC